MKAFGDAAGVDLLQPAIAQFAEDVHRRPGGPAGGRAGADHTVRAFSAADYCASRSTGPWPDDLNSHGSRLRGFLTCLNSDSRRELVDSGEKIGSRRFDMSENYIQRANPNLIISLHYLSKALWLLLAATFGVIGYNLYKLGVQSVGGAKANFPLDFRLASTMLVLASS
jgi:hypothetical protein